MLNYKKKSCKHFNWIIDIPKEDTETMRSEYGIKNVSDFAAGVNTDLFAPKRNVEKDEFELLFTDSMDWLPN